MKHNNATVYLIYILPTQKSYYGYTTQEPEKRINQHLCDAKNGSHLEIHKAIREHGEHNMIVCWLHYKCLSLNQAQKYEKVYIAFNNAQNPEYGYNTAKGGGSGPHTDESKKKISDINTGKFEGKKNPMYGVKRSEKTKKKHSESTTGEKHWNYGKTLSDETKKKISDSKKGEKNPMYGKTGADNPNYGKTVSDEQKKKISNTLKGKYAGKNSPSYGKTASPETRKKQSEARKRYYREKKERERKESEDSDQISFF